MYTILYIVTLRTTLYASGKKKEKKRQGRKRETNKKKKEKVRREEEKKDLDLQMLKSNSTTENKIIINLELKSRKTILRYKSR